MDIPQEANKCPYCREWQDPGKRVPVQTPPVPKRSSFRVVASWVGSFLDGVWLILQVVACLVIGVLLLLSLVLVITSVNRPESAISSGGGYGEPTYCDALQVLVDEVDERLNAHVFGSVSCSGGHANVTLNSDYFAKLDAAAQQTLLSQTRAQWVGGCNGDSITFKAYDGTVVAEL